jgi:hypothetical protein
MFPKNTRPSIGLEKNEQNNQDVIIPSFEENDL